ncbi:DUF4124 domain-containing protein [Crenobacter intestini]|uniref:DUF4124 domain-containing protein n=1 Tax=Crenobacter intestini TaxID=2563443 RepID=A0A4T0UN78_9NEIS|nr:DUF4124 domain-containing protein [Crenobacter intestini]TIC79735.1 DUF4124 domain-containing protein [Crenobacter intestini]
MNRPRVILKSLTALLLGVACAHAAATTIYKFVDQDGHVTYSNIPVRGAQKIDVRVTGSQGGPAAHTPRASSRAPAPAPGNFPSVSASTQQQRDSGRRQILQTELANEQQALDAARRALLDAEAKRQPDQGKLRAQVQDRERNVAALQKELGQ